MGKTTKYWLLKTEPGVFSIDDLLHKPKSTSGWDGVRNYQARNYLRDELHPGDGVLIYHSSTNPPHIAGMGEVVSESYPDPSQFDAKHEAHDPKATKEKPIWFQVDVKGISKFPNLLPMALLKQEKVLAEMVLFSNSRLSVQPVTAAQFKRIVELGSQKSSGKKSK